MNASNNKSELLLTNKLDNLNILLKISNSIISTLDYDEVLQIISDGMAEVLDIETSALYLLDGTEGLYLGATTPALPPEMPDELRKTHIFDHPHIKKTIETKAAILIEDTLNAKLSQSEKKVVELRHLKSLLFLPVIQKNKVLGVLILGTKNSSRIFAQKEIDFAQAVANQFSIGIQNAHLHQELQEKNSELLREIDVRKNTEVALKKSENHLLNALRIGKLGHWEYDIDNEIFTFTDEFFEIFKTSVKEMGGYTMSADQYARVFVHPDDFDMVGAEIKKAIDTNDENYSNEIEHRIRFKNGKPGHIVVRYRIIKEKTGKTIKILGVNQDITKNKKVEKRIIEAKKEAEQREYLYRNLFDQAAEGIFLMNLEGELEQVNKAFANMHGYSVNEIMHMKIDDLDVLKENSMTSRNDLLKNILNGNAVDFEVEHFHKDGHIFPLRVLVQRLILEDNNYLLCFHQDLSNEKAVQRELQLHRENLEKLVLEKTAKLDKVVQELQSKNEIINSQNTELKKTLKDLKYAQSKLVRSEKMASLGILTAGVAHEINNPLNYIMGSHAALEEYYEENEPHKKEYINKLLENIKVGLEKAGKIVKGLNQFSRETSSNVEQCNLNNVIENCLSMLNNKFKHRIKINKNYTKKDLMIDGNIGQLHQVFLNILNNAIQAIKDDGVITIQTSQNSKNLIIEIEDTGIGIPKENLSKITDPFFTTKDPGEGTGLGLSITYTILQDHNGYMEFESTVDKGTKVIITFSASK